MSNEPIYTGPLALQMAGDLEQAKGYERYGRRLLGTMLMISGVQERIARGEPGGFFRKSVTMDDGTRVSAMTNNGQHMLRIETPHAGTQRDATNEVTSVSGSADGTVFVPTAEGGFEPPELPNPPILFPDELEESEEQKKENIEYLWIGVRSTTPNVPWYAVNAILIEPDTGPPAEGLDGPKRGIVTSVDFWSGNTIWVKFAGDDSSASVTEENNNITATSYDYAIKGQYDLYHATGSGYDYGAAENIIPGTHNIEVYEDPQAMVLTSANGVLCYVNSNAIQTPDPQRWLPFDPQADDNSGSSRNYGDRHFGWAGSVPGCLWDVTFSVDPHEIDKQYPVETRPQALALRRCLEEQAGMRTQVLPGRYILALHCYDDTPGLRSTRAGDKIPLYQNDQSGLAFRSGDSDYDEYMKPINSTKDTGFEVEVRMGKGKEAVTLNFHTVVPSSDDRDHTNVPYGEYEYDPCSKYGGPNPYGPNFAPQLIAIDALGGSASWVDLGDADLGPILGGGHYALPDDHRRGLDVYITVLPWSQPELEEWPEYAGRALYEVMEAATAGVYGLMKMHDPGGESGAAGIFAGTAKLLWKWDAENQALTPLPILNPDQYPYGPLDSDGNPTYELGMFWYPPYKHISRQACRNSIAIVVTAVKGQYLFDHGQHVYATDPPDTSNCC